MTRKKNTYEKIVETSLELFNQEGERKITTNHIASYLGISPGNLYYHFRNKDEIIIQLFKRYRKEMLDYLETENIPNSLDDLIEMITTVIDIMWNYRFFFSDVNTLISRSEQLHDEHEEFTLAHISPFLDSFLSNMVKGKVILMDEVDIKIFTTSFWLVIKYWFAFDKSLHTKLDTSSKKRGVIQILGMVRPYLINEFRKQCDDYLEHSKYVIENIILQEK